MNIFDLILSKWLWIYCVYLTNTIASVKYVYYSEGETVLLPCRPGVLSVNWNGPSRMHLHAIQAMEPDIYGELRSWNMSIYFNRIEFNPTLPHLSRLAIVSKSDARDFSLVIKNVSVFDEGLYECDYQVTNDRIENLLYLLQMKALPSEIEFMNSTNDTITGIEQQPLSVVCRVKRGKPPETLILKIGSITVITGGHGIIVYRFNPEKVDHNIQFLCEAYSPLTTLPLTKSVKINIKYKPMITITNDVKEVNEGATLTICSFVDSNPKAMVTWWSKGIVRLSNKNNSTSSCYVISNITRNDTGLYTCKAENEIDKSSISTGVLVRYPPDVKLKFENVTINDKERTMQCIADGTPADYQFSPWEHRSEYNEHIRYLDTTSKGNLILPITEFKEDRFQDSGIYICRVSNGIQNRKGIYEQEGKGYFISTGPPIFILGNRQKHNCNIGQKCVLKLYVLSYSEINCAEIRMINSMMELKDNEKVIIGSMKIRVVFHGKNVTVNGFEVKFLFTKLTNKHLQMYDVTVCNTFGSQNYIVELVSLMQNSSDGIAISSQGIVIIVLSIVIALLIAVMGAYFRFYKQRYRERILPAIADRRPDSASIESAAHYIEINDVMTGSQDHGINMIETAERTVTNRESAPVSIDLSTGSSDTDINTLDHFDDGYEQPYTTVVADISTEDGHVYLATKSTSSNINCINDENAGQFCTEQSVLKDKTQPNIYVNYDPYCQKRNYVENNLYTTDSGNHVNVNLEKNNAQYVNLSLQQ